MTNQAYLCQDILKRDQIYDLQSWCWCEWDFAFQEFMQPWQCRITVIQLGTFHHTAKQLLKAKLRGRWDFCHVCFSALLCSNIEVVLPLCSIDWFVMGCGKCFPVKAGICVQSGFVCSLCRCLLWAGRLCSRAAWALQGTRGPWSTRSEKSGFMLLRSKN